MPDVLRVAGTIWWQEPIKSGQALVHNTALVLKAGTIVRSWQQERLSGIDGRAQDGTETWDRWGQNDLTAGSARLLGRALRTRRGGDAQRGRR